MINFSKDNLTNVAAGLISGNSLAIKINDMCFPLGSGGGSSSIDFSRVTATPEDVAEDKIFYNNEGILSKGTSQRWFILFV